MPLSVVIPLHWLVLILLDQGHGGHLWTVVPISLPVSAVWVLVAWHLGRIVLDRATRNATLELI